MASRKAAAALDKAPTDNKTSVAVRANTSVVSLAEMKAALQAQNAADKDRTMPATGSKIRVTQDKKFILPDGTESAGPLELVIVDFMTVHKFYQGKFDAKNITPPACFAIGAYPKQMTPSKNSPEVQSDSCQGCPNNEFGSDGDGKACKNTRLLAVMPPNADENTPIWTLEASPTAIRGFDGYVQQVSRMFGLGPVGVVTTVSFDESVTYAKLKFSKPVENENLAAHYGRQAEAKDMLLVEPDVSSYAAAPKAGARGRTSAAAARR